MPKIDAHTNIPVMPTEMKKRLLPYSVLRILTGARAVNNYQNKPDVIGLEWSNGETELLHRKDFELAKRVADEIWIETIQGKNLLTTLMTVPTAVHLLAEADRKLIHIVDEQFQGKRGVIFIKDRSGCGYWRMVVPARHLDDSNLYLDCAEVEVIYEYLLEYDTIVVQRLHEWKEFYVIEKLKRLGKKIIYDIDDDIFSIPPTNPAHKRIRYDEQEAARAIMGLADVITTPSEVIKERFGFADKTVVIPNAVDLDDGWPKLTGNDEVDIAKLSSPDDHMRILWQGSPTHGEDWFECVTAVDYIMEKYDNVRLVILGFLPPVVSQMVEDVTKPWWNGRVEFADFTDVETYVAITKHLRVEVALAPLQETVFNAAKSALKFAEYTAIGTPCIASAVTPYKEVIQSGENGFLATCEEEWVEHMETLLTQADERLRLVRNARKTVEEQFDIKKVVKEWQRLLS
jgi:glycosyltransferase involved in cell wall biosynthesis